MVVLPADHLIFDAPLFRHILSVAVEMAGRGDHLLTIGIKPTAPETGYGYLERGSLKTIIRDENIYEVQSIREKPALKQANAFFETGGFYWNSGIFIWKADTILKAIQRWLPDLYEGLLQIKGVLGTDQEKDVIHHVYHSIKPISIDYGVMEKADNALLVEGKFGWSDVGSWDALWEIADKDEHGNSANVRGSFIGIDARNSLIHSSRKLVALVGVEDLIVVETEDALLVCRRGSSQEVKKVVETLEAKNMKEYL